MATQPGKPQITPDDPEHANSRRDPEERVALGMEEEKEKSLDKTLADSFPTSDPPSSIPDPGGEDTGIEPNVDVVEDRLIGLPAGSWAAVSIADRTLVGNGATREEATEDAQRNGHAAFSLVRVAGDAESSGHELKQAS